MRDIVPGVRFTTIRPAKSISPVRTRVEFVDDESGYRGGPVSTVRQPGRVARRNRYRPNQSHGHQANMGSGPEVAQPVSV